MDLPLLYVLVIVIVQSPALFQLEIVLPDGFPNNLWNTAD